MEALPSARNSDSYRDPFRGWRGKGTQRYLVPGDEVTVEIDEVGILTNPVVEEVLKRKNSNHDSFYFTISWINCDWDSEHAVKDVIGISAQSLA